MTKIQCPLCKVSSEDFDDTEHDLLNVDFSPDYTVVYLDFECPNRARFSVVANLDADRIRVRK